MNDFNYYDDSYFHESSLQLFVREYWFYSSVKAKAHGSMQRHYVQLIVLSFIGSVLDNNYLAILISI